MIVFQEKVSTFSTFNSSLPPKEKSPGSGLHLPLLSHLPSRPPLPSDTCSNNSPSPAWDAGCKDCPSSILCPPPPPSSTIPHNLLLPGNTYSSFTILLRQHHLRETLATWGWCPCSVLSLHTRSLTQRLLN